MQVYQAPLLTGFLDLVMNLTQQDKGMKKMTENGHRERKRRYQLGFGGEIAEHVYYVKLNKGLGLLHKTKQEGKITVSRVRKEAKRQD